MCGNYGVTLTPGGPTGMHTCTDFFILLVLNCQTVCFCFLNYYQMTYILVIFLTCIMLFLPFRLTQILSRFHHGVFHRSPIRASLATSDPNGDISWYKEALVMSPVIQKPADFSEGPYPTVSLSLAHTADPLDLLPPCPTSSSHCSFKPADHPALSSHFLSLRTHSF